MASIATGRDEPRGNVLWLVVLLALSVLLNFVDRGAIGIAAPLMKSELGLSATEFGLAVSAFFWVYAPLNFLVGWMSDRFCVYRLFAIGVAVWSLSTLLTGWIGGLAALVVLRLALGFGESVAFPGSSKIFSTHVPASHRGIANAAVATAVGFGPAIGTVAGGIILAEAGWRPIFWIFGAVTLLWLIPWHFVSKPFRAERLAAPRVPPQPLGPVLRTPAVWLMGVAHFCGNYGFYFTLTWLPLYLTQVRGYSIGEMTALATLGLLTPLIAPFAGRWSDVLVARGHDEDKVRRSFMIVAQVTGAIAIAGIALSTTTAELIFWSLFAAVGTSGSATNLFAIGQIFGGPRATGGWIGVQNTIGNMSGVVVPIVTGVMVDRLGGYGWGFALASAVAAIGALWWWLVIPPIREIQFGQPAES